MSPAEEAASSTFPSGPSIAAQATSVRWSTSAQGRLLDPRSDRANAGVQTCLVVDAVRADTFRAHVDALDDRARWPEPGGVRTAVEVEQAQAQTAAKMIVPRRVELIAHRFGQPHGAQQPELGQLVERRVDGAAAEARQRARRATVDLFGREVLARVLLKRVEDRVALRRAAQAVAAQRLANRLLAVRHRFPFCRIGFGRARCRRRRRSGTYYPDTVLTRRLHS